MTGATYSGPNGAEQVPTSVASANFFDVLGVRMALGRSFQPRCRRCPRREGRDSQLRRWQRRFGGDPNILGRGLKFDGELRTVVGVLPRDFQFAPSLSADFWMPLDVEGGFRARRNGYWFYPVGRLKPGVSLQQAQADISALMQQLQIQYPCVECQRRRRLIPLREELVGSVRPVLLLLTAAVAWCC